MSDRKLGAWFRTVSIILILFGVLYVFFGLKIFSGCVALIPHDVLLPWESALYGSIMLGWGVTLFLLGKLAFRRNDRELKRILFVGLAFWLVVEAAASVWFGVWFNVGVDFTVLILFGVPLLSTGKQKVNFPPV